MPFKILFFFLFPSIFIAKRKELAIISLIMFVFGCEQKLTAKITSFFCGLTFESWHTIATKLKENATRKMAPVLGPKNSATGTEKIFLALHGKAERENVKKYFRKMKKPEYP